MEGALLGLSERDLGTRRGTMLPRSTSQTNPNNQVIMATNRIDILDSALLRPGRIDRKIEFPPPNPEARITILKIHSRKVRPSFSSSSSHSFGDVRNNRRVELISDVTSEGN
jgi:SpoVK/Ycf46/Vps4 family AAA+-type ATPase